MQFGSLDPYDAVVLLSFGGPEGPDEVLPFLRRVTAGRGIPDERLADVGRHYHLFGGVSPINAQNRALVAAIAAELAAREVDTPVVLANRNSEPFLRDVLTDLGTARVLVLLTSAYQCYSSCRQYREDLAAAAAGLPVTIDKVRPYAADAAFRAATGAAVVTTVRATLAAPAPPTAPAPPSAPAPPPDPGSLRLVAVAHSVPTAMDGASGPLEEGGSAYSRGVYAVADEVTTEVNETFGLDLPTEVAYCSRSGPPSQPWLEPDIGDRLAELAQAGVGTVVLAPVGFVSDHMEVIYDLDTAAAAIAADHGIRLLRAPTVGTDPAYVAGLVDLLLERAAIARGEAADPPGPASICPAGCCRNLRADLPALAGGDVVRV